MHSHMDMMSTRPYLHFGAGDPLWYQAWKPTSSGAIAGACIGLAMLAMFDRLLVGMRGVLEAEWQRRSRRAMAEGTVEQHHADLPMSVGPKPEGKPSPQDSLKASAGWVSSLPVNRSPKDIPFIPSHDIARGIVYFAQAAVTFSLMLAVMTWNVGYMISILAGLGIGETLFGRLDRIHDRIPHLH